MKKNIPEKVLRRLELTRLRQKLWREKPDLMERGRRKATAKAAGADIVLLDNMDLETTRKAVALRNASGRSVFLEASGNMTLERARPVADIEEGYISSASCILANLSMQLGRTLKWDAAQGLVVGDAEANRLLRRPYRAPWVHPAKMG